MPFTLKLAPLLSVLCNRKMKKNKCQKTRQGGERGRGKKDEEGKTELLNFSALMFPAGEWLYSDDGVSHRAAPSLGVE